MATAALLPDEVHEARQRAREYAMRSKSLGSLKLKNAAMHCGVPVGASRHDISGIRTKYRRRGPALDFELLHAAFKSGRFQA